MSAPRPLPDAFDGWGTEPAAPIATGAMKHCLRLADVANASSVSYLLQGYIPDGFLTTLYGEGGTGKSMLALTIAISAASGIPFCGIPVRLAPAVLYVDFELSAGVQRDRAQGIAEGLGINLPRNVFYLEPDKPLPGAIDGIEAACNETGADFVIIDSTGAGAAGEDQQNEQFVTRTYNRLRSTGLTLLMLDHQAKRQIGQSYEGKTPYGNVYKFNLSRSVIQIRRSGSAIELTHKKHNFGALQPLRRVPLDFSNGAVRYHDPEAGTVEERRIRGALDKLLAGSDQTIVSAADVADLAGLAGKGASVAVGKQLAQLGASKADRKANKRGWIVTREIVAGL
jgi:hypothetical protein